MLGPSASMQCCWAHILKSPLDSDFHMVNVLGR